jgi:hypothetical protein
MMISRGAMVPMALLVVGAILLLVSVAVGWYAYSETYSQTEVPAVDVQGVPTTQFSVTTSSTFYLGNQVGSSTSFSCTGSSYCSIFANLTGYGSGSQTKTYSESGLNHTGTLYGAMEAVVIAGGILGLAAAALLVVAGGRPGLRMGILILAILALILAIVAPMTLLAAQPGTIKSDAPYANATSGSGPWTSFFGSCSASGCSAGMSANASMSWGPSTGWYLAIVAFVVFLLALVFLWRQKGEPVPASAPAPSGAPTPSEATTPASGGVGSTPPGGTT